MFETECQQVVQGAVDGNGSIPGQGLLRPAHFYRTCCPMERIQAALGSLAALLAPNGDERSERSDGVAQNFGGGHTHARFAFHAEGAGTGFDLIGAGRSGFFARTIS